MSDSRACRIGEVANELGINPKTIRYYEEIGLLPEPSRSASGYRLYSAADRERLRFILKAKATGLTLEEVGEVVALQHHAEETCEHVLALIDRKITAVDDQIRELLEFRRELVAMRDEAAGEPRGDACYCWIIEQHDFQRDDPPVLPRLR